MPEPAQSGIRITTGGGKSEAFRQVIAARYIPEAKRLQLPHRVLIAVPTHKLAAEARTKMPDGVTVAIWQGLKATKLGTNEPMCLNHAAVDAALALGADVETTACRRGQRGGPPIVCPFYEGKANVTTRRRRLRRSRPTCCSWRTRVCFNCRRGSATASAW